LKNQGFYDFFVENNLIIKILDKQDILEYTLKVKLIDNQNNLGERI
jgi:uncharacterized membrane protein